MHACVCVVVDECVCEREQEIERECECMGEWRRCQNKRFGWENVRKILSVNLCVCAVIHPQRLVCLCAIHVLSPCFVPKLGVTSITFQLSTHFLHLQLNI